MISEISNTKFNNQRLLIAYFQKAEEFYSNVFKKHEFSTKNSKAIVQQRDMSEEGLSEVERRVILEVFEQIGINEIYIDESTFDLNGNDISKY